MGYRLLLVSTLLVFTLNTTYAEDKPKQKDKEDNYKGEINLGYVSTSGNTDTQTLSFKAEAEASYKNWAQLIRLEALNSSDNNVRTAERYAGLLKTDYNFTKRSYAFGLLGYESDKFNGYKYQSSIAIGYGYKALDEKSVWLNLEAGPGGRFSKLDSGEQQNEVTALLAGRFGWQISDNALFEQDLSSEIGEDTTITRSRTALTANIIGSFAMRLSYRIRYNSEPPPETKHRDTEALASLVYKF